MPLTNNDHILLIMLAGEIEASGVRYAICDYRDWSDINDQEFQEKYDEFLKLNKRMEELENYFQDFSDAAYKG